MKLTIMKPKKMKNEAFIQQWVTFILNFFNEISQDDLEQVVFALTEEFSNPVVELMIKDKLVIKNKDLLSLSSNGEKIYSGINFETAPVNEFNNCDLWDLGDSLKSVIKIADIEKVLQQLVYTVEDYEKYSFSVTSLGKNYMIRAGTNDYYTRFYKKV